MNNLRGNVGDRLKPQIHAARPARRRKQHKVFRRATRHIPEVPSRFPKLEGGVENLQVGANPAQNRGIPIRRRHLGPREPLVLTHGPHCFLDGVRVFGERRGEVDGQPHGQHVDHHRRSTPLSCCFSRRERHGHHQFVHLDPLHSPQVHAVCRQQRVHPRGSVALRRRFPRVQFVGIHREHRCSAGALGPADELVSPLRAAHPSQRVLPPLRIAVPVVRLVVLAIFLNDAGQGAKFRRTCFFNARELGVMGSGASGQDHGRVAVDNEVVIQLDDPHTTVIQAKDLEMAEWAIDEARPRLRAPCFRGVNIGVRGGLGYGVSAQVVNGDRDVLSRRDVDTPLTWGTVGTNSASVLPRGVVGTNIRCTLPLLELKTQCFSLHDRLMQRLNNVGNRNIRLRIRRVELQHLAHDVIGRTRIQ